MSDQIFKDILLDALKQTPNLMDYVEELTGRQKVFDSLIDDKYGYDYLEERIFNLFNEEIDPLASAYILAMFKVNKVDKKVFSSILQQFIKDDNFKQKIIDDFVNVSSKSGYPKDQVERIISDKLGALNDEQDVKDMFSQRLKNITQDDITKLIAKVKIKDEDVINKINDPKQLEWLKYAFNKGNDSFFTDIIDTLPEAKKEAGKLIGTDLKSIYQKIYEVDSKNGFKLLGGIKKTIIQNIPNLQKILEDVDDEFGWKGYFTGSLKEIEARLKAESEKQNTTQNVDMETPQEKEKKRGPASPSSTTDFSGLPKEGTNFPQMFQGYNTEFLRKYGKEIKLIHERYGKDFVNIQEFINYCEELMLDPIYEGIIGGAIKAVKSVFNGDQMNKVLEAHRMTVIFFVLWAIIFTTALITPNKKEEEETQSGAAKEKRRKRPVNPLVRSGATNPTEDTKTPENAEFFDRNSSLINAIMEDITFSENIITNPIETFKGLASTLGSKLAGEVVNFIGLDKDYDRFVESIFNKMEQTMVSKLYDYGFYVEPEDMESLESVGNILANDYTNIGDALGQLQQQLSNSGSIRTIIKKIFESNGVKKNKTEAAGQAVGKALGKFANKMTKMGGASGPQSPVPTP